MLCQISRYVLRCALASIYDRIFTHGVHMHANIAHTCTVVGEGQSADERENERGKQKSRETRMLRAPGCIAGESSVRGRYGRRRESSAPEALSQPRLSTPGLCRVCVLCRVDTGRDIYSHSADCRSRAVLSRVATCTVDRGVASHHHRDVNRGFSYFPPSHFLYFHERSLNIASQLLGSLEFCNNQHFAIADVLSRLQCQHN